MDRIAIVGTGLAGFSAAQRLRRVGYGGSLVMIGGEPHFPYRRPPLSKEYLRGSTADLSLPGADELDATWLLGHAATGLDLPRRRVLRGRQPPVDFDGLVIATGVRARRPRGIPAVTGVHVLRGLDDARAIAAALVRRPRVVIVGAGFLGSELASTLDAMNLSVTVVEADRAPLRRAFGDRVAAMVADLHRAHGVDLRVGRRLVAVTGAGRVERVHLDDGTVIPAGLLVVALGADPQVEWLRGSGLDLDGGVVLGADGLAAPAVAAAGDVARWPHPLLDGRLVRVEHYSNAIEQGRHAARALLGAAGQFAPVPSFWCHIYDLRLQAVGFTGDGYDLHLASHDPDGRFLAEYRRHGRVVGALTAGFVRELPRYREEITRESARRLARARTVTGHGGR